MIYEQIDGKRTLLMDTKDVYIRDAAGEWKLFVSNGAPQIPGTPGPAGAKGDKGDPGTNGAAGKDGGIGPPGATGSTGPKGADGITAAASAAAKAVGIATEGDVLSKLNQLIAAFKM